MIAVYVSEQDQARAIITEVAEKHGLVPRLLAASTRLAPVVRARDEAVWRLREELGLGLKEIGFLLGGRDHSTIIHSLRKTALERAGLLIAAAMDKAK